MSTPEKRGRSRDGLRRHLGAFAAAVAAIGLLAVFAASLRPPGEPALDPAAPAALRDIVQSGARYVSDSACAECHREHALTYAATAHANTSAIASRETVHGDFTPGSNMMRTADPNLEFRMESDDGRFTQAAILRILGREPQTRKETIDLVIGSGRKGQTYLHWQGDELCQLPVSYWAEHRKWVNSPGYADGTANFERPIPPRCLECHATTAVSRAPPENRYEVSSLVPGLSCQKCHGPGEEHVKRYRSKSPPTSIEQAAIINPAKLSRDRQMDVCALCHAGEGRAVTPPLSFRPGDVLSRHITFPAQPANAPLDVHASQIQLLERSRCYQESRAMSCTTCHDVHRPERDLAAMAGRCLQCHQVDDCGTFPSHGQKIATSCVDCHMPLEQTGKIVISGASGGTLQPKVRNHRIAIYPTESPAAP